MAKIKQSKRRKFRLTIGTKLVGLIAVVLLTAVISVVWVATRLFIQDNTALIQQMNSDAAGHLATRLRESFEQIGQELRVFGVVHTQGAQERESVAREILRGDDGILAMYLFDGKGEGAPKG